VGLEERYRRGPPLTCHHMVEEVGDRPLIPVGEER
jgi:hypothetical protein